MNYMYALLAALMMNSANIPTKSYIGAYTDPTIASAVATKTGVVVSTGGLLILRASIRASTGRTITGITIGGNAMTLAVASASSQNATAIFTYVVTPGTYTFALTASGAIDLASFDLTVVNGLSSNTPIDTDSVVGTGTGTNRTLTLTDNAIGFWTDSHGSTGATTWSGSGLTTDHDSTAGASHRHSSVTYQAGAGEDKNAASNWATSVTRSMCAAAWR